MDRRSYMKALGAGAGATVIGGFALSGNAAAGDTQLEGPDEAVTATTDDGEIRYVAYGGRLRFEWDGLDSDATWGGYAVEARLYNNGSWESWQSLGSDEGELNADWGGSNDYTEATGTDGVFQFKYGSPYGQDDYAIAYNSEVENNPDDYPVILVNNSFDVSKFYADSDGGDDRTVVQIRKICRVYDGDPNNGGSKLVEDSDTARFEVIVNNRPAEGETGGEIDGTVGADES